MRAGVRSRSFFRLPIVLVAVGGVVGCLQLGTGVAHAGDYSKIYAAGIKHSRKAASLAGANNCRAAVPEYTKAFRLLKDPVLLFNRAECHRTLGDRDAALADYRRFLVDLPAAPNRAQVEAQIAALDAAARATVIAEGRPAAPAPAREPLPSPGNGGAPIIADAPPAAAPPAAPPALVVPGGDPGTTLSPRSLAPDVVHVDDPATLPLGSSNDEARAPLTRRWWFWTALAVVAVGAGVATYLAVQSGKTEIPSSQLGNYRF